MAVSKQPSLRYRPQLASDLGYGIGIIGAGTIVRGAHLPAYRKAGFQIRGLYDLNQCRAKELANEYGLPTFDSIEALLADETVSVVDIAVPARHQLAIVRRVTSAGKHILCQKPLAESFEDAKQIVRLAHEARVKLAVNQNSRWAPAIRSSRFLIEDGWIGQPLMGHIDLAHFTDWGIGIAPPEEREVDAEATDDSTALLEWAKRMPRLLILQATIHHIESVRSIFGMPNSVYAVHRRDPEQWEIGETIAVLTFQFESGVIFSIRENARNQTGESHARFRFEGTKGVLEGSFGRALGSGRGTPDTLRLNSSETPEFTYEARFTTTRFPDAFVATMGELLSAIAENREPEHGGRDNLNLLRIVFAAYRSAEQDRPVAPMEIT
jgi:predicted dehydrogenase